MVAQCAEAGGGAARRRVRHLEGGRVLGCRVEARPQRWDVDIRATKLDSGQIRPPSWGRSVVVRDHRIIIELTGSEATRGLPLFNLESFIDALLRGLRAFDRSTRLEPGLKAGHPTSRDTLVTAFRLVEMKPGSAILTLEPDVLEEEGAMFDETRTVAVANLEAMLEAVQGQDAFDPDVADALGNARRALGSDGQIRVKYPGQKKRFVIDERVDANLHERALRKGPRGMSLSGRLHLIDVEPDRIGIRAPDGVEWSCKYPAELEPAVKALLDENVWARGTGQLTGAQRGSVNIVELQPVGVVEQTPLFTYERVELADLMEQQGVVGPPVDDSAGLSDDLSDEQIDSYLAAVFRR